MTLARLDHIVLAAETLDEGTAHVAAALGIAPSGGGTHDGMGTHNRLLSLGNDCYLEVLARLPGPAPDRPRLFDMDNFSGSPRLTNWVMSTDRISDAVAYAPEDQGGILALSRGALEWEITVPADGRLPFGGAFPGLIEWHSPHPAPLLPASGCRLTGLTITHPDAPALRGALAPFLGDPRVRVVAGGRIAFVAEIDTPAGRKTLT